MLGSVSSSIFWIRLCGIGYLFLKCLPELYSETIWTWKFLFWKTFNHEFNFFNIYRKAFRLSVSLLVNFDSLWFSRNLSISSKFLNLCRLFAIFHYPFNASKYSSFILVIGYFCLLSLFFLSMLLMFFKELVLVLLTFLIVFLLSVSLVLAFPFIISFLLIPFDLFCSSFLRSS